MIITSKLTKRYGRGKAQTLALKGIDLSIPAGQFVSIIGTSGSGKTTLLNVIGGLDRDFEGSVSVAGKALESLGDRQMSALRNESIGFVFQHFHLLDHLSCVENVMLPSYFDHRPGRPALLDHAREMLVKVGLESKFDDLPTALSGGQKQRVAIARALFNKPRIILCDEPTGSLDRKTGVQIMDLFRRLVETEDLTLVVITHEEHISRMADRVVRLEDGEVESDEQRTHEAAPTDDLAERSP